MSDHVIELDDNVLAGIAALICGDDVSPYYRRGFEIEKFFKAAGWPDAGELDGYRKDWTLEQLQKHQHDSERMERVLLRLADPREYIGEDEARTEVVRQLNELLAVEGYQVDYLRGRPRLVEHEPSMTRPSKTTPLELTASIADIVHDAEFGRQLQSRLDEAYLCWTEGAPTAAIIMLGSVLEGVLYDVAKNKHEGQGTDRLEKLIDLAEERGWIAKDVTEYAHVLRGHRNLVHPKKQWANSYSPEHDTVHIAWQVVVAALNDLAAATGDQARTTA
ncbi:hypothetical protein [Saccharopolyspora gregorii]|uniref:hypothetical protein n=1 Tax=Saccharopolyspora gregorii TaxID=33914 RepID=UPI0021ABCEF0|nr:hypothetical protein [Saccharopolyspora gregorii]